ncbi:UDP-glucosyltransferase 2-like [Achroia grisella]|uniref:UDP-glucosyltransferase 2-like n=1 Tax=Achroia grisella TaxID=688607 RepID=UPI0027D2A574|nr:UDP-glucosyltransferase 2-like [Achroia grisella]
MYIEASKILAVIPSPSISHQVVFRPLILELVARGHEVVVITPNPMYPTGGGPANLTEIDVGQRNQTLTNSKKGKPSIVNTYADIRISTTYAITLFTDAFFKQLNVDGVKKLIEDKDVKFDLLIVEAWFRPTLAFTHKFKAPVIRIGSAGCFFSEYQVTVGFGHPLYHPSNLCSQCANLENLSVMEKIYEVYNQFVINNFFDSRVEVENEVMRRYFGADMPSLDDLSDNVDLLINNIHHIWEFNRPTSLNVVHVGGIHLKSECTLPENLKQYLDSSNNGVVYISFGTNVLTSGFSSQILDAMVSVASKLPLDVLWKWDDDEMPGRPRNIKISKWLPQECLLKHPKIKLFITQGGLQSTEEAIVAGVPLVGIPLKVDQFGNVENYVRHKIGVKLLLHNFSEETFRDAIYTVLNDNSYRQNVERLRTLIELDGGRSAARAARWVEHVARHGGSHLHAPAARLHAAVYHHLQLLAELAAAALFACFIAYTVLKILFRLILKTMKRRIIK